MDEGSTNSSPCVPEMHSPGAEYEARISSSEFPITTHYTTDYFCWRRLPELSEMLQSLTERFGEITGTCVGERIALGTEHGNIIICDYIGRVKTVLGSQTLSYGAVSSLGFSADCLNIIVGYSLGYVAVWDWGKGVTVSVTRPLRADDKHGTGHPYGTAITHVQFIGISKHRYVSCSAGGYIFYHHIIRRLLTAVSTVPLLDPGSSESILFDVAVLPYGNHPFPTDDMGLVAIVTSACVTVYKTRHGTDQIYRLRYPHSNGATNTKQTRIRDVFSGSVSWLPALKSYVPNAKSTSPISYSTPKLAFSWNNKLVILSLHLEHNNEDNSQSSIDYKKAPRVRFENILEWNAVEDIVFCRWVDASVLLFMTQSQRLFAIDTLTGRETEICESQPESISSLPWVTLATGIESEPSYSQMMHVYKKRLFAITKQSFYTGRLLTWAERLTLLIDKGRFIDAIILATGFYAGQTGQVVIGLPHTDTQENSPQPLELANSLDNARHQIVNTKLVELVRASLRYTFSRERGDSAIEEIYPSSTNSLSQALLVACIEACLTTSNMQLLFGEVFETYLASEETCHIYLETLEPFIRSGKLTYLAPQVLNAMIEYYGTTPILTRRLGECLTNLRLIPGEFDVDKILQNCRKHNLWRTYARVWLILGDPIAPVNDILMETRGNGNSDDDDAPATVIFEYLEMVLSGRYYPDGNPIEPQSLAEKYCSMLIELIFPRAPQNPKGSDGSLFDHKTLLALLDLSTDVFLAVLRHVLGSSILDSINIIIKPPSQHKKDNERSLRRASQVKSVPQVIVDAFYDLTIDEQRKPSHLTPYQVGLLSSFSLTLYSKRYPLVFLSEDALAKWMQLVLNLDDPPTISERENAFELVFRLNPPNSCIDYIELVRKAKFYRVLRTIYSSLGEYDKSLFTYIEDTDYSNRRQVFADMCELAKSKEATIIECIIRFVTENAVTLIGIDADALVSTVNMVPSLSHEQIIGLVNSYPQAEFAYLRSLLDSHSAAPIDTISRGNLLNSTESLPPDIGLSEEQNIVYYPLQSLIPSHRQTVAVFPQRYYEQYIELLCKFDPNQTLRFLKEHAGNASELFRLDHIKKICKDNGAVDGLVWAQQQLGDFSGALETLLAQTDSEMESIKPLVPTEHKESGDTDLTSGLSDVDKERLSDHLNFANQSIKACIQVCKTATDKLTKNQGVPNELETQEARSEYQMQAQSQLCDLWLTLLRRVLSYLHKSGHTIASLDSNPQSRAAGAAWDMILKRQKWMLQSVLDSLVFVASPASSFVSLRYIIRELMSSDTKDSIPSDPKNGAGMGSVQPPRALCISEAQHLLTIAVRAYKSESQLMELTNILVDYDLFTKLAQLVRAQKQGWYIDGTDPPSRSVPHIKHTSLISNTHDLCCSLCGQHLFIDRRQELSIAKLKQQTEYYFQNSALRLVDLHVFEDPKSQWQWIKLRNASASYKNTDDKRRTRTAIATLAGSNRQAVLLKCGHNLHWECCPGNDKQDTQDRDNIIGQITCPMCNRNSAHF